MGEDFAELVGGFAAMRGRRGDLQPPHLQSCAPPALPQVDPAPKARSLLAVSQDEWGSAP